MVLVPVVAQDQVGLRLCLVLLLRLVVVQVVQHKTAQLVPLAVQAAVAVPLLAQVVKAATVPLLIMVMAAAVVVVQGRRVAQTLKQTMVVLAVTVCNHLSLAQQLITQVAAAVLVIIKAAALGALAVLAAAAAAAKPITVRTV